MKRELHVKHISFLLREINRDGILLAVGRDRDDFSNKELYDHVMKILNIIVEEKV